MGKSPEEVTTLFWQALAQGQVANAAKLTTETSGGFINPQDIDKNSAVAIGEATVEDEVATVETTISRNKRAVNFNTVLLRKKDAWKVDYLQTQMNIALSPFGEALKSLQNLGGAFSQQLEQHLPQIQREMESLGNELKNQIDELGRSIGAPGKLQPRPGTI